MTAAERKVIAAADKLLEEAEDMKPYVPEYFQEKWRHGTKIAAYKAVRSAYDTAKSGEGDA